MLADYTDYHTASWVASEPDNDLGMFDAPCSGPLLMSLAHLSVL